MSSTKGQDQDKVFGPLKKEWLQENGYKGQSEDAKETQLFIELRTWISEFLKEMNDKDGNDMAQTGCAQMNNGKTKLTEQELRVCEFILKNLLKIWKLGTGTNKKERINIKMKKHIYCTIINSWLHEYMNVNCEAGNIMKSAYDAMEYLCELLNPGGECKECEYKQLEPMVILTKISMLQHIRDDISKSRGIMDLINKKFPKKTCPKQQKSLVSATHPQQHPNVAAAAPEPKKMTTQQFHFISKLLTKWIRKHGMDKVDQFGDKVWADFKKIFDELIKRLQAQEPEEIMHLCGSIPGWHDEVSTPYKKELCKGMVLVKYFMNGIRGREQGKKTEEPVVEKLTDIEAYLRCLVGTLTMLELYGDHCKFGEIANYIMELMKGTLSAYHLDGKYEKCTEVDAGSLTIGQKILGNEVKKWAQVVKRGGDRKIGLVDQSGKVYCKLEQHHSNKEEQKQKEEESVTMLLGLPDKKVLEELRRPSNTSLKENVKRIAQKVKEKRKSLKEKDPCYKNQQGIFADDEEELTIGEWFTRFFNQPTRDDEKYKPGKYDWNKFNIWASVCDSSYLEKGYDADKYKDFCRIMLKNLMMVTNKSNQHEPKSKDPACKEKHIPPCDLLKVWMLQMKAQCAPKEVIDYVFEAMDNLSTEWEKEENYVKCEYRKFTNLRRGENIDMVYELHSLLQRSVIKEGLGTLNSKGWCEESKRQYVANVLAGTVHPRPDGRADNGVINNMEEMKELQSTVGKVGNILKEEENAMSQILGEAINEVIPDALKDPQPPSNPAPPSPSVEKGENCKEKGDLCDRVKCVSEKWHQNKGQQGTNINWDAIKNGISKEVTEMFGEISTKYASMKSSCTDSEQTSKIVTAPEIRACQYITSGLQYIYGITEDDVKQEKNPEDNRLFKQTMLCLVLNAYADELGEHVKSPCKVDEKTINQAFEKGNKQKDNWCAEKMKGTGGDCIKCERKPNLNCTVGKDSNTYNAKNKVKELFSGTNGTNIQKTLTDINTINENSLCDRVQCVISQWTRDRREEEEHKAQGKRKKFWEKDSWTDIPNAWTQLIEKIPTVNVDADKECNNIAVQDDATLAANKEACKYVTRAFHHIYSIQTDNQKTDSQAKNYRKFKQTMACVMLNEFVRKLEEQVQPFCSIEEGIKKAFELGAQNKSTWCADKKNGDCDLCKKEDYKNCQVGGKKLSDEVKMKLEGHKDIKTTLYTIDTLCKQSTQPKAKQEPSEPNIKATESTYRKEDDVTSTGRIPQGINNFKGPPLDDDDNNSIGGVKCVGTGCGKFDDDDQFSRGTFVLPGGKAADVSINLISTPVIAGPTVDGIGPVKKDKAVAPAISTSSDPGTAPDAAPAPQDPDTGTIKTPQTNGLSLPNPQSPKRKEESTLQIPGQNYNHIDSIIDPPGSVFFDIDDDSSFEVFGGAYMPRKTTPAATKSEDSGDDADQVPKQGGADHSAMASNPATGHIQHDQKVPPVRPAGPSSPSPLKPNEVVRNYFFLGKRRKRYKRAHQVRGPATLEEQLPDHGDHQDCPHEYTLVKKRRQPRSVPTKTKKPKERVPGHRGLGRRMIIDIHLEVLDECQKEDLHSTKENFFEILVQEFIGSEFIKEEYVPEEQVSMVDVPKELVQGSDSRFREI
ncbi:SICA antigen [Plasmodium coatneyi]|uniref:SICA antigen n=1 Tax=Plasmodium coatneyi TaxID=208452 RepID=A0A1B1E0V4_9APIC|nr:SICA antigen [Plasmodium coatneyi]ANQ08487.1 SICA antigen [Plasmodium coatneyi]